MSDQLIIYGGFACLILGILSIIVEAWLKSKDEYKDSKYILASSTITKLSLFIVIGCIGYLTINTLLQTLLNTTLLQKPGFATKIKKAFNY